MRASQNIPSFSQAVGEPAQGLGHDHMADHARDHDGRYC